METRSRKAVEDGTSRRSRDANTPHGCRQGGGLPDGSDPARPVRVYADGIFDMFHFGHARALEQAKKLFEHTYLVVGCCSEESTRKFKGKTVFSEGERYESLRHCKWVDEVITDAPWVVTQEFMDKHNIHYVAHDALPYKDASGQADDVYAFVKEAGRFKETKRTEGISTSDIILRITKGHNDFVLRNLQRGYSRKDVGVSFLKEKRLKVTDRVQKKVSAARILPRRLKASVSSLSNACGNSMSWIRHGGVLGSMYRQIIAAVEMGIASNQNHLDSQ